MSETVDKEARSHNNIQTSPDRIQPTVLTIVMCHCTIVVEQIRSNGHKHGQLLEIA